jgi:hypothetical protein
MAKDLGEFVEIPAVHHVVESGNWIRLNMRRFAAGAPPAIMASPMLKPLDPFRFLLVAVAGWMNQNQLRVIDYLREENRFLREQLGERRLRLSDDQRRRLAEKAKLLGRRILAEVATIVTPETLLACHRKLIA